MAFKRCFRLATWSCAKKLALILYIAARILANLLFGDIFCGECGCVSWQDHTLQEGCTFDLNYVALSDFVARPLITVLGAYIFLARSDRFSPQSRVHVWSRRNAFFLAACFLFDPGMVWILHSDIGFALWILWQILSNAMQIFTINVKLENLSWRRLAMCCNVLLFMSLSINLISVVAYILFRILAGTEVPASTSVAFVILGALTLLTVILQGACISFALCRAAAVHKWEEIRWTLCYGSINCVLSVLGPITSGALLFYSVLIHPLDGLFTTLDFGMQIANSLVLSGMIGPQDWSSPEETFSRLRSARSGFNLASNSRIAFTGRLMEEAASCIASFPGKYSTAWEEVTAQLVCSVACVFLPDKTSGLGEHTFSATSKECWCRQLYGDIPKEEYLRVVELSAEDDAERLAFEKRDAAAMGKHLLIRYPHTDNVEWELQKAAALEKAEQLWRLNCARAPWGCAWFSRWKANIDRAKELQQTLHIFYFEGQVGAGKLSWDELHVEEARKRAAKAGGLGASQKAEVAYLDKLGLSYVEHDVSEFTSFITGYSSMVSL